MATFRDHVWGIFLPELLVCLLDELHHTRSTHSQKKMLNFYTAELFVYRVWRVWSQHSFIPNFAHTFSQKFVVTTDVPHAFNWYCNKLPPSYAKVLLK